jgi:DNA sulfur modification protein DndC
MGDKRTKIKASLTKEMLEMGLDMVRQQYLADSRPWVIGYSGGKDSTCVLQLVWRALMSLPAESLRKPIYVVTSDTYVESPIVERHLAKMLDSINAAAKKASLPVEAIKVGPPAEDSFWVNLIGRGYPAPYNNFRWCTDRMKIQPTTSFILSKVNQHGEVLILLGARKAESGTRAQVMQQRREVGTMVFRHNSLPNAWVFTPIENWSTEDVWTYLTSTPPPWGGDNRDLITMYRNAQAGECPLVIDKSTPSCGGGRFGCWVCTVVDRDRTMEAMIDNGELWLQAMLDFRNWLAATGSNSTDKNSIRDFRRRTGRIQFYTDTQGCQQLIHGPFKVEFRKEILRRLLETQIQLRSEGPDKDVSLIRDEELHQIRQIWLHEEGDWEDSLPAIYERVMGERLEWLDDDWSGMGGAEKRVLEEAGREYGVPDGLLIELMDKEREFHGMSRRAGVYKELHKILKKDWRSLEEAWADEKRKSPEETVIKEESRAN